MVCIYCGHITRITNSRSQKKLVRTWRRHTCLSCKAVFTTIEAPNLLESWRVTHEDGLLRPFERDKLFLSVYESLKHRDDAIASATALTDTILTKLIISMTSANIPTKLVTTATLEVLQNFDAVARVHYAAFHRPI